MSKDVTIHRMLSLALAVVFVILVYLLVTVLVQADGQSGTYYEEWYETQDMRYLYRVGIANFLAYAAAIYAVFALKGNRELRQGLLGGAAIVLVFTVILLIPVNEGDYALFRSWMMFGNFVFLTLFATEYMKVVQSRQTQAE